MRRYLFIVLLIGALSGCSPPVQFAGVPEMNYFDVKIALPHNGRGSFSVTPESLTWQKGSLCLTFHRSPDGALLLQRNGVNIGTALPGQSVTFTDDGHIQSLE